MATVEPIKNKKDILKVEKILAKQGQRDLLLFTMGTNCGLRISDILQPVLFAFLNTPCFGGVFVLTLIIFAVIGFYPYYNYLFLFVFVC